jgi:hypothetical protein
MTEKPGYFAQLASIALFCLAVPVFIGPGIVVWQLFEWLKTGAWHPVPVTAAFDFFKVGHPVTNWAGVQKMIEWGLDLPLSVVTFLAAMTVLVLVVGYADGVMQARRLKKTRQAR